MNTCRTAYSLLTFLILAPCLLAQQTTICNFVELEPLKIAGNWGRLVAGDFNADGNMDVVSGTSTRFGVFLGVGDGTFVVGSETEILPSDSPYLQLSGITGLLQPGDLDGDGTLDPLQFEILTAVVTLLLTVDIVSTTALVRFLKPLAPLLITPTVSVLSPGLCVISTMMATAT